MSSQPLVSTLERILEVLQEGVVHLDTGDCWELIALGKKLLARCSAGAEVAIERLYAVKDSLDDGPLTGRHWLNVALLGDALIKLASEITDAQTARLTRRIGNVLFHSGHAAQGRPHRVLVSSS